MEIRLKELREKRNKTQKQVASELGFSIAAYYQYENKSVEQSIIPLKKLIKIAQYYGVSLDYLVGIESEPYLNKDLINHWHEKYITMINELQQTNDIIPINQLKWTKYPFNLLKKIFDIQDLNQQYNIKNEIIPLLEKARSKTLTERKNEILTKRYEFHQTLKECGDKYGITRERIRQVENQAIDTLRDYLNKELIELAHNKNIKNKTEEKGEI